MSGPSTATPGTTAGGPDASATDELRALGALVAAFGAEHSAGSPARRASEAAGRGELDLRETLRALLTIRGPGPLPAGAGEPLDRLLAREATARGSVLAPELPTLAETHGRSRYARVGGVLGRRVALWRGDLTTLRADAIVNAANDQLLGCFVPQHRCIDNVIHAAAGPALRADCEAYIRSRGGAREPTGTAVITAGHHLPAGNVLHTVGPIVQGKTPSSEDAQQLASCYRSILDLAAKQDLTTVGFCSISTGVFGYPKDAAARVALNTLEAWFTDYPDSPLRAVISLFADIDVAAYENALTDRSAHDELTEWKRP